MVNMGLTVDSDGRVKGRALRMLIVCAAALFLSAAATWAIVGAVNAQSRVDVYETYSVLARPMLSSDSPREGLQLDGHGAGGVVVDSVRSVGSVKDVEVYLALDKLGNVCLLFHEVAVQISSSSCTPPDSLENRALALGAWNHLTGGVEAYYVPDDFASSGLPDGVAWASPNLLAFDSDTTNAPRLIVLTSLEGERLEIARIEQAAK